MSLAAYTAKTWTDYADSPDLSAANVQYMDSGIAAVTAEVIALELALPTTYQPISAELSALAGLSSTGYAKRTGAGAWSVVASIPQADVSGLTAALAGLQPLDSDLTAIAALTTTTFGRSLLTVADAAAARTAIGAQAAGSYQASSSVLTSIAAQSSGTGLLKLTAGVASLDSSVYALASSVPVASSTTPASLGTAAVGTGTTWARADHVHAMPTAVQVGAEPTLGNPGTSGYLLSSTIGGVRSWVAPYAHPATHPQSVVDSASGWITTALAGKQAAGSYLTAASSLDPAKVAQTASYRLVTDAEKAVWNSKQAAGNYSLVGHGHAISEVSGLQTALDGKQASLGFTPVQQGGGTSQSTNKLYIGWSAGSALRLQVDTTDFGSIWPIAISGSSADSAKLGGQLPSYYALESVIAYTGTGAVDPNTLTNLQSGFTQNTAANRPGNYAFVQTLGRYNGGSMQIASDSYGSDSNSLWWRRKGDNGTWYPWKTIWHTGNLTGDRTEHFHSSDRAWGNITSVPFKFQNYPGAPTVYEGFWPSGVTPSGANFAILWSKDGAQTYVSAEYELSFQTVGAGGTREDRMIITDAAITASVPINGTTASFSSRCTQAGSTIWDAGNLTWGGNGSAGTMARSDHNHSGTYQLAGNYVTLDTAQTISGIKTFSATPVLNAGMKVYTGARTMYMLNSSESVLFRDSEYATVIAKIDLLKSEVYINKLSVAGVGSHFAPVLSGLYDIGYVGNYWNNAYINYVNAISANVQRIKFTSIVNINTNTSLPIVAPGEVVMLVGASTGSVTNNPVTNAWQTCKYRTSSGAQASAAAGGETVNFDLYGGVAFLVGRTTGSATLLS